MSENVNYIEKAADEVKLGGNIERAQVYAALAIAQAISDLAAELRGMGTQAQPFHTNELS